MITSKSYPDTLLGNWNIYGKTTGVQTLLYLCLGRFTGQQHEEI